VETDRTVTRLPQRSCDAILYAQHALLLRTSMQIFCSYNFALASPVVIKYDNGEEETIMP